MSNSNNAGNTPFQLDEFYFDLGEDGQISFLEKSAIKKNPFPGLRPFKTSEFELFHGRDGQAEHLINRLKKNHFLAVIGSSGTGKSSLIRAGLIPQLMAGYLHEAGTNWDIAICRPGSDPLENLAFALARVKSKSNDEEKILQQHELIEPLLTSSIYGILEVNELLNPLHFTKSQKSNLLIVVDQFEELFRFKRDLPGKPGVETRFVDLLLKAAANPDSSIYVIITMRSEFLGDSVKFRGLPEAINEGQYLVPQLSRDQIKEVIEGPIKMTDKEISAGLVELLVNEIEESKAKQDLDQLPILQHALMRTYQQAANNKVITYDDYKDCGGMEKALSIHAESKYKELGTGSTTETFKQKIARIIFQALTDASTDQKGGRRPTQLKTLYEIAASVKAGKAEVDEVINKFRDTETSFIMPPANTELYPELIIDISHESLIRQWTRLRGWVNEEAEYGKTLLRLAESQKLYEQDVKGLLTEKELAPVIKWYRSFKPQPAWAKRYTAAYAKCFDYLLASEKAGKRKQLIIQGLVATGILAIAITAFVFNQNRQQNHLGKELQKQQYLNSMQIAVKENDTLKASLFLAEALQSGDDPGTILNDHNNFAPDFYLADMFQNKSDVESAAFSNNSDTLFIWNEHGICFRWDLKNRRFIDSLKDIPAPLPHSDREVYNAVKKLHRFWGINDAGYAMIIDGDMVVNIKVPGNVGSFDRGTLSTDTLLLLTFGMSPDQSNVAWIWDMKTGKQSASSFLHESPVYSGIFNSSANKIVTWDEKNTIRVIKKFPCDHNTSDKDIPADLFKLQLETLTGARLDQKKGGIEYIPVNDWQKLYKEWEIKSKAHYAACKYKEHNYWACCFPNTAR